MSASATRMVAGVRRSLSNRSVYSITATSPRRRTSSIMAVTIASTFAAVSRFVASNAENASAKPGARASSLSGIGDLLDPGRDLAVARLQRRAVDDQPRRHVGDPLDLHQAVRLQRSTGRNEIDD